MKLLLVDETRLYPTILAKGLQELNVDLHVVATGREALSVVGETSFDLIAISMELSDMDGVSLTEHLRKLPQCEEAHTPIVIITGSASRTLGQQAEVGGVTEVFRKQDINELVHFLRRFLARHRSIGARVLYVEDNKAQRMAMMALLQQWQIDVDGFSSADDAWLAFQKNDYDVVITDIVLDGQMSGSRFVNRIRRTEGLRGDVPILAITAFDSTTRRAELFHLGVSDYVSKPVIEEELYARVQSLISTKHLIHREIQLQELVERAEHASAAKSEFLATMSHEIRTPLNGILGMAQILLMDGEMGEEERKDYARTIHNSGQTLLSLLNDILDLSKVEAGKMELSSSVFDPRQVIEETARLFMQSAKNKGLSIESKWLGPPCQRYEADSIRLRQMLSNLISNAIKFTAKGFVRIEAMVIEEDDQKALLEFSVTDSGVGISHEIQGKLFHPFIQADRSTAREYGGTGLGLSIIRSLANLMNGTVGVESEPDKGARFWFRVWVERVVEAQETHHEARHTGVAPQSTSKSMSEKVLVVEDNATNQKVVEALLKKLGFEYVSVENGQQAINILKNGEYPCLVLMDMQMPIMDGITATRHIRDAEQKNNLARLPIIALTANAFEEDSQRCREAGMDDFLTKPISLDALKTILSKWIRASGN